MLRNVLSVYDYSGRWSAPYRENGYNVLQIDIKLGEDARLLEFIPLPIHGILLAPPCTDFSLSGAQYWPEKDASGATLESIALVDAGLRLVAIYSPLWWVLENPRGRIDRWLGPPRMEFDPADYGDPYTKKTRLWGKFNPPYKTNRVEPIRVSSQGSWIQKLGGKSERTKQLRSLTPPGFAQAFFEANP